jgi:Rieske Fe-S protein
VIGGIVGVVVGGAVVSPGLVRRGQTWLPASFLGDLRDDEPTPVTLQVVRADGFREFIDQRVVFLMKMGDSNVVALDSTCSHLGCRVTWDPEAKLLKCPCHNGAFDSNGEVKSGPPPTPLTSLATRIDGGRVMVQI